MALIASENPCSAAAVFTTNKFRAAPVLTSAEILSKHSAEVHGIVVNAGCANACTGDKGMEDARQMSRLASQVGVKNALVMSTGVIGPFLDMKKIESGINDASKHLTAEHSGWDAASRAIMTTDTVPKLFSKQYNIGGVDFSIAGMVKGAGMIHPNMATMLGAMVTDLSISPVALDAAVKYAVERSYNCISIDGDTSTNDTVAVLANGQACDKSVHQPGKSYLIPDTSSPLYLPFQAALTDASIALAQRLVRDGEGATKFITVEIKGARTYAEAKTVAHSIATSALFKTAMFGKDANWGRILCAVGYSGIQIQPEKVNLWFVGEKDTLHLVKDGRPFDTDEARATALLQPVDVTVRVDLGLGAEAAKVWTCDFSIDYVKINADYRS